jgi:molecular chaperone DnaJ
MSTRPCATDRVEMSCVSVGLALRQLAFKYYPDHSSEPDAEERFKEIGKAYGVLSDPQRRADYDARGFEGIAGMSAEDLFGSLDLGDLLGGSGFTSPGGLFGRLFGFGPTGRFRSTDVEVDLTVPLESIVSASEATVHVPRTVSCEVCHGTGAAPGTMVPLQCSACEGSGQRISTSKRGGVAIQQISTCSVCHGVGKIIENPCDSCTGTGVQRRDEDLKIRIPAGIEEGTVLRAADHSEPSATSEGRSGDLYVMVRTTPHPEFVRRGADLWRVATVSIAAAVLGAPLTVARGRPFGNLRTT